jgi:hypothetical protein
MAFFDIMLHTGGSLHPGGEPSDYVSEYGGTIRYTRDRDGKVFRVGRVKAYRLHVQLARQRGELLFEVCDSHSTEMEELYLSLFDPGEDDFKEDVRARFSGLDPDVLVLDYVLLHPRWRGLKLGLLAARKMIDLLGGGCGLAVSYISPLRAESHEFAGVPAGWIPTHRGREEKRQARLRLRRYFRRMGFERIPGTRFHGLSLARSAPTLEDLLRPRR